jgi:hypothetical protein
VVIPDLLRRCRSTVVPRSSSHMVNPLQDRDSNLMHLVITMLAFVYPCLIELFLNTCIVLFCNLSMNSY